LVLDFSVAFFTDVYVSEILDKPIIDRYGRRAGLILDLVIGPGVHYPCILKLVIKVNGQLAEVAIDELSLFNRFITTMGVSEDELKPYGASPEDILIKKHILDKQILDVNGAKVVRVNDVKLGEIEGSICVSGIDVGLNGILRRIDGGKFIQKLCGVFRVPVKEQIINWHFLQSVDPNLKNLTLTVARRQLSDLHPSDLAAILTEMPPGQSEQLLWSLDEELAGETLHELPMDVREKILKGLDKEKTADILEEMPPDEAADILGDMPEEESKELLSLMEPEDALEVGNLLGYEEDTAGGLMTSEFLDFPPDITVETAIADIRLLAPEIDFIYYIYVIDEEDHLLGVLSLKKLLTSPFTMKLEEIMTQPVKAVYLDSEQKEIADIISKYDFIAIPVLGEEGKLKGVITVDDIFDLLVPNPTRRRRGTY
jgi:magnesium transporter